MGNNKRIKNVFLLEIIYILFIALLGEKLENAPLIFKIAMICISSLIPAYLIYRHIKIEKLKIIEIVVYVIIFSLINIAILVNHFLYQ